MGKIEFLDNKYTKWYLNIIGRAIVKLKMGYVERHHIIPKSFGGSNKKDNIVRLTAREHFICHLLLVRMVTGKNRHKMICAAWYLKHHLKTIKISSRTYEILKIQFSNTIKSNRTGKKHSEETKKRMSLARLGQKTSKDTKLKLSLLAKSRTFSKETREKMSKAHTGSKRSEEIKSKMTLAQLNRWENMSSEKHDEIIDNRIKKNHHLSDETKAKMSESIKSFISTNNIKNLKSWRDHQI